MFENYFITQHAIERYAERVSFDKKDIIKRIKHDLHFSKVKRIVNHGNIRHIFTYNSKEFIFIKDGQRNTWILKTVIKRSRKTQPYAMRKRELTKAL